MKNIYIVVDTETYSKGKEPFDVSWLLMDKKGKILLKRSYLIKEIYLNRDGKVSHKVGKGELSKGRVKYYEQLRKDGKIDVKPMIEIREQFMKDCSTGLNTTICAYNCSFDETALENAMYATGHNIPFTYYKWHDISNLAKKLLTNTDKYIKFVAENELYTEENFNGKTNAETVYGFLTNNPNFIESHMTINNVEVDAYILKKCFDSHKKLEWADSPQKKFKKMLAEYDKN